MLFYLLTQLFVENAFGAGSFLTWGLDYLNKLMKNLSLAVKNLDPSMKSDIRKVNNIIEETCNEIAGMIVEPSTFTYFSPEGIKITCNFINKFSSDISATLDNPSIVFESYVEKLKTSIEPYVENMNAFIPYVENMNVQINSILNRVEALKILSEI